MTSRDNARAKVEAFVNKPDPYWTDRPRVVVHFDVTIERPYGRVFLHDVPGHVVAGNAPVLVTREDDALRVLGTALPVETSSPNSSAPATRIARPLPNVRWS